MTYLDLPRIMDVVLGNGEHVKRATHSKECVNGLWMDIPELYTGERYYRTVDGEVHVVKISVGAEGDIDVR